jgi:hypothetical protein
MKSRRMRWTGHVARMGEKRNAYSNLTWPHNSESHISGIICRFLFSDTWNTHCSQLWPCYHVISRFESMVHYTGCFTTLGHNCRRWFPRSLE